MAEHQRYVDYWNGNQNISQYILERAKADYEIVLCLEYFPYVLEHWLGDNPKQLESLLREMRHTITLLQQHGLIHFDVHLDNIMTDGHKPYLSDFGLTLDKQFDLSASERAFFDKHRHYDYGEFLYSIGWHVFDTLSEAKRESLKQKYGIKDDMTAREKFKIVQKNFEKIYVDDLMNLADDYVKVLKQYQPVILFMHSFSSEMRSNTKKNSIFDNSALERLLKEADFLPTT